MLPIATYPQHSRERTTCFRRKFPFGLRGSRHSKVFETIYSMRKAVISAARDCYPACLCVRFERFHRMLTNATHRDNPALLGLKAWEIRHARARRALMRRSGLIGFCLASGGGLIWPLGDVQPATAMNSVSTATVLLSKLSDRAPATDREDQRIVFSPPIAKPDVPSASVALADPQAPAESPRKRPVTLERAEKPAAPKPSPTSTITYDTDWYKTVPR